jgi:hypothetical protein
MIPAHIFGRMIHFMTLITLKMKCVNLLNFHQKKGTHNVFFSIDHYPQAWIVFRLKA